jgi:hypothetical protein
MMGHTALLIIHGRQAHGGTAVIPSVEHSGEG